MCSGRRELLIAVLSALFAVKIQIVPAAGIELAKTGNSAKILQCCIEKELEGCWECDVFPCKESMLDNIRIRALLHS